MLRSIHWYYHIMMKIRLPLLVASLALAQAQTSRHGLDDIQNIVVIYAENRSFDVLYGSFPGANGVGKASPASISQADRDGSELKELPPVWGGLTAKGVNPPVT